MYILFIKNVLQSLFQILFSATLKKPVHNFQTNTNYLYDIHRMIHMQIENQFNEKRKTLLFKYVAWIHENLRKDPNAVKYVLGTKIFLWHMGIVAGLEFFICLSMYLTKSRFLQKRFLENWDVCKITYSYISILNEF